MEEYKKRTIGHEQLITTPYGCFPLRYFDWAASGRLYEPIENRLHNKVYPLMANTHTASSHTGAVMSYAYEYARKIIRQHVNASDDDLLITTGTGMTGAINKLQSILGLKPSKRFPQSIPEDQLPVVFITHMEHHSNDISWRDSLVKVVMIQPDENGQVDLEDFRNKIEQHRHHPLLLASVTAASNVTGLTTPVHQIAALIHEAGGRIIVDYTAAAPYRAIDMHPVLEKHRLDAVVFSPHKFLGGPGTSGVLLLNKELYLPGPPDYPGGGTVDWVNLWGEHRYVADINQREDGGTPGILQAVRIAMAIKVKEKAGVERIHRWENELSRQFRRGIRKIKNLHLLAPTATSRLPFFSFYIEDLPYDLGVQLLNDHFGIQVRGGCSCAGPYGHILLQVDRETSKKITDRISMGDTSTKPGWIRVSLHFSQSLEDIDFLVQALTELAAKHHEWRNDYVQLPSSYCFRHKSRQGQTQANLDKEVREDIEQWYEF